MKTLAERLDDEERACDEQERLRQTIAEALKRGQRDADAMWKATRGMFGQDASLDRLVLR